MSPKLKVIGLSGTNGAGKDTVGRLFADHWGYLFISVTDLLRAECERRGLAVERHNLRDISAEWRREHGYGVLIDKAMEMFATSKRKHYVGVVMASLRHPAEADRVHEFGGTVVWIDADPKVRYARIQTNAVERGRHAEDTKTFEQFLAEEAAEMHHSGDLATLNMADVKARADVTIWNNTTDLNILERDIEQALDLS